MNDNIKQETFWIVWSPERGPSKVKHCSQDIAIKEAIRLSKKHLDCKFHVMRLDSTWRTMEARMDYGIEIDKALEETGKATADWDKTCYAMKDNTGILGWYSKEGHAFRGVVPLPEILRNGWSPYPPVEDEKPFKEATYFAVKPVKEALSLLNSMVYSGESHSTVSEEAFKIAMETLTVEERIEERIEIDGVSWHFAETHLGWVCYPANNKRSFKDLILKSPMKMILEISKEA